MSPEGLEEKISRRLRLPAGSEKRLVEALKEYFRKCGRENAVIGISGGVDSSLVCYLAARALSPQNVFAYYMPYVQSEADELDARQLVKMLGVHYQKIDIRQIVDKIAETVKPTSRIASGNVRVRARMLSLYTFAHQHRALVLGTGNRTELLLGYFTKYGDGGTDLLPIGGLLKTQVWELARISKLPDHIIEKVPSAGMWQGQTDEGELGVSYGEIDRILTAHFDLKVGWDALQKLSDKKKVQRVRELHELSEHKRRMPGIIAI